MSTTLAQHGEVNVLTVEGELVAETVGQFQRLVEQCRKRDRRDFVVDLHATRTLDSAGLEALTALQQECEERLGLLKLCGLNATVRKILEMTRLEHRFDCCPELAGALTAIGSGAWFDAGSGLSSPPELSRTGTNVWQRRR
ncbi:MAG: STAS domain-containing protein [Planctomycetota bacterium]|jgi:anti-anti-sigma factor